ncbi:MAG: TonB family protein [Myxococcales bacterium]|nr:TonB family protein [Myxococcales bacterium]
MALHSIVLALMVASPHPDPLQEGEGREAPDAGAPQGVLTKAPALLKQVEARFPEEALDAGVGGRVEMEIDIGPDGKVMEARVSQSAGPALDEAALEAVRQFEFSPAEVDGQPAAVRILYSYEFFFRPKLVEAPPEPAAVNFSGLLLERGTREPIANATVVVGEGEKAWEAVSKADGRFELRGMPPGVHKVVVTSPEHARYQVTEEVREGLRTEVTYFVRRRQYGAYETVVRAPRERKEVAQVSLKQEEIRLIPGTQGDALKVVQNLPGVARAPFSLGLLIVRGGKPWDTRVYVDDALVPLLFHFGGLYATFNSALVEEISFHPGNFSAEYGRNIGGLVNATTRAPSAQGYHGYFDTNLIDSSAMVEGPIGGGWSFAAGARRSYIDATLPFVVKTFVPQANVLAFTVAPRYYDYQLKVERRTGPNERFWVTLFGSNDQIAFVLPNPAYDPEGRGSFASLMAYNRLAINYERALSPHLRLLTHNVVGYDRFDFVGGPDLFFRSHLEPVMGREMIRWEPSEKLQLAAGLDLFFLPFQYVAQGPRRFKLNQIPDPFLSRRLEREEASTNTFEPAAFAEAVYSPVASLKLVGGVRLDYDALMKDAWVDPRAAAFYELGPSTTVKAGVGLFHQPPDYRQGQLSPKFGNPELLPEGAAHYSVGLEHRFTDAISVDVQLYYKSLFNQSRTTLALSPDAPVDIDTVDLQYTSTGVGRSYGAEVLVRHQLTRNFFGWLSYSLSRSERDYPGEAEYRLHPLDQPHNLIAVASYKLPYDFVLGGRIRYASGPLTTPFVGAIYDANGNYYFPLLGPLFSRRLPSFFQLDVRLDKRFVYERWMLSLYADVMNVTNHGNVEGVVNNFDFTQEQFLYGLPILPSLGIRGEF